MGQVELAGMCKNFSTLEHSCRKCLCSLENLRTVKEYSDISARNHTSRNDQVMQNDYLESKQREVKHINGICDQSLFFEFPYFETSSMLPQGPFIYYVITCRGGGGSENTNF